MVRAVAVAALVSSCIAGPLAASPAGAATWRGHSVDGRRFAGSILNADIGKIDGVEIRFRDDHAYVNIRGYGRLVLILEDEEITDPHRILGDDLRRGVVWEIDVQDLSSGAR
jgi:hypothetical protein